MIQLRRWGLLSALDVGVEGDPYLDRLRLVQTPLFAVFLHHIHKEDGDRDCHDHPWWFASLVLTGGYREIVCPDKTNPSDFGVRVRRPFSGATLRRRASHTITHITGPLWTLVITGPSHGTSSWGFWPDGKFVPWRAYQSSNGFAKYAADKDREDRKVK